VRKTGKMKEALRWCGVGGAALLLSTCSGKEASHLEAHKPAKPASPAKVQTENAPPPEVPAIFKVGTVGVIPLSVPDFSKLGLSHKRLVFELSQAVAKTETVNFAMAGPRILRTRRVLQGILNAKGQVPMSIREKIAPYAHRFFLNVGPRDAFTGERIRPAFIPGELAAAAKAAIDSGVDLGIEDFQGVDLGANRLEQLEALLADIREPIFGPKRGAAEMDTAPEKAEKPSPEESAAYLSALAEVVDPIQKGVAALDEGAEKEALAALAGYLTSPSMTTFSAFTAKFSSALFEVETFIGPFGIASGGDGARRFQGMVAVRDRDQSALLNRLAAELPYFERRLPGNAMFIRGKKEITIPNVAAYHLVTAAPFGAISMPAFHFPAPMGVQAGASKAMLFTNVLDAEDDVLEDLLLGTLSAEGESKRRMSKWRRAATTAFWALKYVVGFDLGTRKGDEPTNAAPVLRWVSVARGVLAEMHADLAALHFAFDPKLQKLGLVPEPECALAVVDSYLSRFLAEAPIEANPGTLEGRAVIARRIIMRRLLNTAGVRVIKEAGRYVVLLEDADAFKNGIGELLAEAQRMVSLGEEKSGERLIAEKGGPLPMIWRNDVVSRFDSAAVPIQWTYGYPAVVAKRDEEGGIKDIDIVLTSTLSASMREVQ
jgi:hypothetical protein